MRSGTITRASTQLLATLKEAPADSEAVSHQLLVRGGYVRQLAAGLYTFLPSGWRVMRKIEQIIREEMNAIGGQEVLMPLINPRELWEQTGRVDVDIQYALQDRSGRDMVLAFTHEEAMTWHASRELRSYRDLPQTWWQLQNKARDEARARGGLLRTREFTMKDSYSFDRDEAGLDVSYRAHAAAYDRIFSRCGLDFYSVESDTGDMGGTGAHEYMAPCRAGENDVALCDTCGYRANVEIATSRASATVPARVLDAPRVVSTPGARTIAEVSALLGVRSNAVMKSVPMMTDDGLVLALVRGDHDVNEIKLANLVGPVRTAHVEEIRTMLGSEPGYLGPMGVTDVRIVLDSELEHGSWVTGANEIDTHLIGVQHGRDFDAEIADIRTALPGDTCAHCGGDLRFEAVIEIGNIFKLGTRYSSPDTGFGATYLDENGSEQLLVMGSYGIGPARIMAAAAEQRADDRGIAWPVSIAPWDVHIVVLGDVLETARTIAADLAEVGCDVLLDERTASAGPKFADADLLGCPVRVTIGARSLAAGGVDLGQRAGGAEQHVVLGDVVAAVTGALSTAS